ncbi:PREDICTED: vomeronasal type-1 receptor 1-like [Chinchilla lanigera]|uniref:vomeronasal type-1 receptor 1-like n=1 Tax=Chinchilla lanigera TaxID=34839 RepID=UPI00038F14C7|nr:PREDICTED: vomeronasal type-1 receptor 1-like [Chinchilla lanigera]
MSSANVDMGIIFLIQTSTGILGNSTLLCFYSFLLFSGHTVRPTDLILGQLVLANSMVLFTRGVPQTVACFGWKPFLDDVGCKLAFYLHRVGRGVSLSTTCLLSVFQALKLCTNYFQSFGIQIQSPRCISFCCVLLWVLHLFINIIVPLNMTQLVDSKNVSVMRKNFGYCSAPVLDKLTAGLHAVLFSLFDVMTLGIMCWASGSMVLALHRHRQRVQHIHSHSLSSRPSHEARATRTILILVSSFILFNSIASIFTFCFSFVNPGHRVVQTSLLASLCFPTLSSFLLISTDSRISQFCFSCWQRQQYIC